MQFILNFNSTKVMKKIAETTLLHSKRAIEAPFLFFFSRIVTKFTNNNYFCKCVIGLIQ